MTKLEHLHELRKQIASESGPYRPGLLALCQDMRHALLQHEREQSTAPARQQPPRTTALGHKPAGPVVTGAETHTDAALEALECSD